MSHCEVTHKVSKFKQAIEDRATSFSCCAEEQDFLHLDATGSTAMNYGDHFQFEYPRCLCGVTPLLMLLLAEARTEFIFCASVMHLWVTYIRRQEGGSRNSARSCTPC